MALPTAPTASSTQGASTFNTTQLTTLTTPYLEETANNIVVITTDWNLLPNNTNELTLTILDQGYGAQGTSQVFIQQKDTGVFSAPKSVFTIDHALGYRYYTIVVTYPVTDTTTYTITVEGDNATFTPIVLTNPSTTNPTISISAPTDPANENEDVDFAMVATATDAYNDDITISIVWTLFSDTGVTAASTTPATPTVGGATQNIQVNETFTNGQITATITDNFGNVSIDSLVLNVSA